MNYRNISQNHSGSGNNVYIENVSLGHQPFVLTDDIIKKIVSELEPNQPVALGWLNRGSLPNRITVLQERLEEKGIKVSCTMQFDMDSSPHFNHIITIGRNGIDLGGLRLMGGQQAVVIDPRSALIG